MGRGPCSAQVLGGRVLQRVQAPPRAPPDSWQSPDSWHRGSAPAGWGQRALRAAGRGPALAGAWPPATLPLFNRGSPSALPSCLQWAPDGILRTFEGHICYNETKVRGAGAECAGGWGRGPRPRLMLTGRAVPPLLAAAAAPPFPLGNGGRCLRPPQAAAAAVARTLLPALLRRQPRRSLPGYSCHCPPRLPPAALASAACLGLNESAPPQLTST
jgi:hypothetical protein